MNLVELVTDCQAILSLVSYQGMRAETQNIRSLGEMPSAKALFSVVVPYSSVPQMYKVRLLRVRLYLAKTSADIVEPIRLPK